MGEVTRVYDRDELLFVCSLDFYKVDSWAMHVLCPTR